MIHYTCSHAVQITRTAAEMHTHVYGRKPFRAPNTHRVKAHHFEVLGNCSKLTATCTSACTPLRHTEP